LEEEAMKFYGKRSMSEILAIILNCTLVIGFIGTLVIFYNVISISPETMNIGKKTMVIILLAVGICCVFLMVFELKNILNTLVEANPFVEKNVRSMRRISIECFIIAVCYFINFIFGGNINKFLLLYIDSKGIHTDMEFFIFVFAGCFIYILSKVFQQAIKYKEDNDFTI
jgi:Protein of unknown function (DUF3036).